MSHGPESPAADFREPPFRVSKAKRSIELCSKQGLGDLLALWAEMQRDVDPFSENSLKEQERDSLPSYVSRLHHRWAWSPPR